LIATTIMNSMRVNPRLRGCRIIVVLPWVWNSKSLTRVYEDMIFMTHCVEGLKLALDHGPVRWHPTMARVAAPGTVGVHPPDVVRPVRGVGRVAAIELAE
jgi:hypothetical protein